MRTIAKVFEQDEDERHEQLCWSDNAHYYDGVVEANPDPTISELAEFLDQDAESCNRHSYCGVHQKLVELMVSNDVPTHLIAPVMTDLAGLGGLHRALIDD